MNRRRFARRALLRGALAAAFASIATAMPGRHRWPGATPWSAAAGLASGAALEDPLVGAALAVAGASVLRARPPRTPPATIAAAVASGAAAAMVTRRVWPLAPRTPAEVRSSQTFVDLPPEEDGSGVVLVVNRAAGSPFEDGAAELLRTLPAARVVEVEDGSDLPAALRRAAADASILGVAGGDGSINAAAAAAHRVGTPLLVIPAGTLNHLARDLGLDHAEDAVAALRDGHAVAVDLGTIDGQPFLNTASVGGYTDLVDARERLENRIGKWPALLVALVGVLRRSQPVRVELDGRERSVWMIFVGNCRYEPAGFAPTWREKLDDGTLDVRLIDAAQPWARLRLLLAVVTGRLGRCRAYEAFTTRELRLRALDGPVRLARDGETFDGSGAFTITKEGPLSIYVPRRERSPA